MFPLLMGNIKILYFYPNWMASYSHSTVRNPQKTNWHSPVPPKNLPQNLPQALGFWLYVWMMLTVPVLYCEHLRQFAVDKKRIRLKSRELKPRCINSCLLSPWKPAWLDSVMFFAFFYHCLCINFGYCYFLESNYPAYVFYWFND